VKEAPRLQPVSGVDVANLAYGLGLDQYLRRKLEVVCGVALLEGQVPDAAF